MSSEGRDIFWGVSQTPQQQHIPQTGLSHLHRHPPRTGIAVGLSGALPMEQSRQKKVAAK